MNTIKKAPLLLFFQEIVGIPFLPILLYYIIVFELYVFHTM